MRSFAIREATRTEADFIIEAARREGWNPGLHDAEPFFHTDPGGFLIGLLNGTPVSSISAVSYNGRFGFIGFYIVVPDYRGQGFGIQTWEAGMRRLDGMPIGLDGVLEQESSYTRYGFHKAYRNIRFQGHALPHSAAAPPGVFPLANVPFETITRYDRQCFPADRETFLRHWLAMPDSKALGCMNNGRLQGYGVIRQCHEGYKIGPLFADDAAIAETLYSNLAAAAKPGEAVYLDVPERNSMAMELAQRHNMKESFATCRMYYGEEPQVDIEKIFGVTTFELG